MGTKTELGAAASNSTADVLNAIRRLKDSRSTGFRRHDRHAVRLDRQHAISTYGKRMGWKA